MTPNCKKFQVSGALNLKPFAASGADAYVTGDETYAGLDAQTKAQIDKFRADVGLPAADGDLMKKIRARLNTSKPTAPTWPQDGVDEARMAAHTDGPYSRATAKCRAWFATQLGGRGVDPGLLQELRAGKRGGSVQYPDILKQAESAQKLSVLPNRPRPAWMDLPDGGPVW
jgi:hypothetical protein